MNRRSLRTRITLIATAVVAVPVVAVAALAAVSLKDQAMALEAAPSRVTVMCVGAFSEPNGATKEPGQVRREPVRHRQCVDDVSRVEMGPLKVRDLTTGGITEANGTIYLSATYSDVASIPQLSLWPFTDPYAISHVKLLASDGALGPMPMPDTIERVDPKALDDVRTDMPPETRELRERLAQTQRSLNARVLRLVGGALLLIALFAVVVWVATGRVLRPVVAIRREMADITEHDLSRRVPVPRGRHEIAELATAVNATLDRLEVAVEDNRRFVADASHELRSPIAALRAELEIATAHPGLTDWPAVVDAALADTHRLQHLATDLLLLARLDHTTTEGDAVVDITALVREHTADRRTRHALTVDLPDRHAPVRGRRALLDRLLGNLLDNAELHAATAVTVRLTTTAHHVILEVLDDGPGIPPEDRDRVFDRFTRLDRARTRDTGGTGLGLAIARRIATTHAGTLDAADPDTGGARLVATLPLATGAGHPASP